MTALLFSPILHKLRAKVDLSTLARLLYSPECHPSRHRRAPTVTIKRGDSQVFGAHASSLMPQPQLDRVQHSVPQDRLTRMLYKLAASALALFHLTFILFVVFGALLVLKWPKAAWIHLPAAVWGVLIEFAGWYCPLTRWENLMLRRAGEAGYSGGVCGAFLLSPLFSRGRCPGLGVAPPRCPFGGNTRGVVAGVCACGSTLRAQTDAVKQQPDIIVATPGGLLDHVRQRHVSLDTIEELVLDEADHMLDLGFLPQMRDILRRLPKKRHTMMFSATMPDSIEMIAKDFMNDPVRVDITPVGAAEGISHRLYLVKLEDKRKALLELLHEELGSTLVFTRRKIDAEWLEHILQRQGHTVTRIHADRSQSRRGGAVGEFPPGPPPHLGAPHTPAPGRRHPRHP